MVNELELLSAALPTESIRANEVGPPNINFPASWAGRLRPGIFQCVVVVHRCQLVPWRRRGESALTGATRLLKGEKHNEKKQEKETTSSSVLFPRTRGWLHYVPK